MKMHKATQNVEIKVV